jgi:membrane protein YdbS with pleckstrin-like domain
VNLSQQLPSAKAQNRLLLLLCILLAAGCIVLSFTVHNQPALELATALAILFFFVAIKYIDQSGLTDY